MTEFQVRAVWCVLAIAVLGAISGWAFSVAGWLGWLLVMLVSFLIVCRLGLWLRAARR